ncbi:MAG: FKBP-type peptidyl-prolyl cis-trans isomerase [Acidobacteriota bacterium]|nr:FKBP-type peptidyl-prolyl cis-trans isomerase [Acidobacteriota bacterium]
MRAIVSRSLILAVCTALSACAPEPASNAGPMSSAGSGGSAPETEEQKILNALGQALGQNVLPAGLSAEEFAFVRRGLEDAVLGRDPLVELSEYGPQIQGFVEERVAGAAEGELTLATAFVEEQAGVDGVERTESGIVIQPMTAGNGPSPSADDTVRVHYHGTLRDGTVFDSSIDRGEPATFPLGGVIPCWTEGLQRLNVGGKSRLICPPDLAYGPAGRPGIPGNAALVFEVELLEIVQD